VTEAWPHKPYTFRALRKTFGAMWVRCDLCRRYAPLSIGGLQDVDYRSKTFSCSQCGSEAYLAVIEPIKEVGMQDYRLDAIERPERHTAAIDRLTGRGPSTQSTTRAVNCPDAKSMGADSVTGCGFLSSTAIAG
jgi:hypothetical protein